MNATLQFLQVIFKEINFFKDVQMRVLRFFAASDRKYE